MGLFLLGKSLPVLGGFISGNTALYLSGFFAGTGDLRLSLVLLIGFAAVLVGDTVMFIVGKYFSDSFPRLKQGQSKIQPWLDKTHQGRSKITYLYMHSGLLRPYLPFILGYSKMSNMVWGRKLGIAVMSFVPVIVSLGYLVGRLDVADVYKAIISGALWVLATSVAAKIAHEVYTTK